jgi:hypothetical protein
MPNGSKRRITRDIRKYLEMKTIYIYIKHVKTYKIHKSSAQRKIYTYKCPYLKSIKISNQGLCFHRRKRAKKTNEKKQLKIKTEINEIENRKAGKKPNETKV